MHYILLSLNEVYFTFMYFNLYFNAMWVVIDGHISVPFECEPTMQLIEQAS